MVRMKMSNPESDQEKSISHNRAESFYPASSIQVVKAKMAYLFASSPASYAEEKLSNHLGSLSTLPVHLPQSSTQSYTSQPSRANPVLEAALHELSASRPLTLQKVADVLRSLAKPRGGVLSGYVVESEVDRLVEAEVMARAVTMVWKEVMQVLLEGALALEEEKSWWDASLSTRRGVGIYLVQSRSIDLDGADTQLYHIGSSEPYHQHRPFEPSTSHQPNPSSDSLQPSSQQLLPLPTPSLAGRCSRLANPLPQLGTMPPNVLAFSRLKARDGPPSLENQRSSQAVQATSKARPVGSTALSAKYWKYHLPHPPPPSALAQQTPSRLHPHSHQPHHQRS